MDTKLINLMDILIGMMTTAGEVTLRISEDDPVLDLRVRNSFCVCLLPCLIVSSPSRRHVFPGLKIIVDFSSLLCFL